MSVIQVQVTDISGLKISHAQMDAHALAMAAALSKPTIMQWLRSMPKSGKPVSG